MTPDQSVQNIVSRFVDRINSHDIEGLLSEISEDHEFIDSVGEVLRGKDQLRTAWQNYFKLMPDYQIVVRETLQQGSTVGLFGWASATYAPKGQRKPENKWNVPAAWKAVVRNNKVSLWQVFADTQPVTEIIERVGHP